MLSFVVFILKKIYPSWNGKKLLLSTRSEKHFLSFTYQEILRMTRKLVVGSSQTLRDTKEQNLRICKVIGKCNPFSVVLEIEIIA